MKIGQVVVKNFQSYKELSFDFADLGLALVSGDTGSGKSTLMDAAAWVLFGVTSKDGAADDVKAWDADGITEGTAEVKIQGQVVTVTRIRGAGKNDLYWYDQYSGLTGERRGKDLTDTQKQLEGRLGVTAELFLMGSYMTQFSKADSFFIAKAKDRREVLEKIADQEFAVSLGEKASEARKKTKKERDEAGLALAAAAERRSVLSEQVAEYARAEKEFESDRAERIARIETDMAGFEDNIKTQCADLEAKVQDLGSLVQDPELFLEALQEINDRIAAADNPEYVGTVAQVASLRADMAALDREIYNLQKADRCPTCKRSVDKKDCTSRLADIGAQKNTLRGQLGPLESRLETLKSQAYNLANLRLAADAVKQDADENQKLITRVNQHKEKLSLLQTSKNPYGVILKSARSEINPFTKKLKDSRKALQDSTDKVGALETSAATLDRRVSSLTWLYDKAFELRGILMAKVVSQVESNTNAYLERFFDAALRVKFNLTDSDKLDVEVSNRGFPAPFRSLSGGERTMLKLCFTLSLMRAAQDKAGISFGQIFLDEPLNGLSDSLKVKAFGLFQQLQAEYPTVMVIEHSVEFKAQFDKVYAVNIESGRSEVHES